jgi:RHS repeat-associated protein
MANLTFGGKSISDLSLGYSVDVDPFTGGSTLSIPVPAAEARDGMAPELVLAYSSGAGNSAYGAGWSLSGLAAIGIDNRRHVPRWDYTDGYQFGNDELVPWLENLPGGWTTRGFASSGWSVALYRSRRGGAKTRVEKWTDLATGRVHFRTRDAYNRITIYGARPNAASRIADSADEARTFAWLPELIVDARGNAIWIEYFRETADGVDRTATFERRDPSLAQRYLKRIFYGNRAPIAIDETIVSGELPAGMSWCFQLVLDYGDHDVDAPQATPDGVWLSRQDPFSTYSCGFEVRTYRLCRRFLTFHQFAEIGDKPELATSLMLTHAQEPSGSMLTSITLVGHRTDKNVATQKALPPLKMTYSPAASDTAFVEAAASASTNAPAGLAASRYTLLDLFGEGLPGILYQADRTWFYKPNLGNGEFGAQSLVTENPAAPIGAFVSSNLKATGNTEFAQLGGREAGLYEFDRAAKSWRTFCPFGRFPHTEALSNSARWVDLNGDRREDLVVTKLDCFTWFASDGEEFVAPIDIPLPRNTDGIPTLADDTTLNFIFADMTGDGLMDMVRVSNGCVVYWPALGNGLFGDMVVMEDAPQLDLEGRFDASRRRLADLDGSGTTDLIYLGEGEVRCWINACGNRLVPGPELTGLPYIDNISSARVLDFLGDGRSCLVWSSPLPARDNAIQYLRLTPVTRPRLLSSVDDSLGYLTTLSYSSSASHYLRDLTSGRGWSSRLPGHHVVVERKTVMDQIAKTVSTRRFEYHDGYYDGDERELRGFGSVDIYDSDPQDAALSGFPPAALAPAALERRWFHLGTPMWDYEASEDFYRGDPHLPVLAPHLVEAAEGLSTADIEEGLRALSGEMIRGETYAISTDGIVAEVPIDVVQRCLALRPLQPRQGGQPAAFAKLKKEDITWVYEQEPDDPRVHQEMLIEADAYDRPLCGVSIGYARRANSPPDIDAQKRHHIRLGQSSWASFDLQDRYEFGIPVESKSYELAGIRPSGQLFRPTQFTDAAVVSALASPGRHDVAPQDDPLIGPAARLMTWEQTFYWDDARAAPCNLGSTGSLTLLHHEEAACFETDFIPDVFAARVSDAMLTDLGYVQRSGFWWQADETHVYTPANQFSQLTSLVRGDGAKTQFSYDPYLLEQVGYTDAVGNTLTAVIDYFQLAPWRITDPNGTVTEVLYDPLGVSVASTTYGRIGANPWGFDPLAKLAPAFAPTLDAAVGDAAALIQGVSRYVWYDLTSWSSSGRPTCQVTLSRESLVHDGKGDGSANSALQIVVSYIDGNGRILQEKQLVEPGPAIARDGANQVIFDGAGQPVLKPTATRWRSSGHMVYDIKERPLRQFEPFFTITHNYEGDGVLQTFGTAISHHYDVLGRSTGDDLPNGTLTRLAYHSWRVEEADSNDTIVDSAYAATRKLLPIGNPERQAYDQAVLHANTLQITYLDPLARESGRRAQGGTTAADRFTQSHFDLNGCELEVIDPRGIKAFSSRYDMQDQPCYQHSSDAGETWRLSDANGRDTHTWDSRGFTVVRGYDALDRPVFSHVTGGPGTPLDHRVEEWVYGESLPDRNDAIARNLLGRVAITRDGAQQMIVEQCDPAGRAARVSRQLRAVVDKEPDWRSAVALEPDIFIEFAVFDGLGRPISETLADGTVRTYAFAPTGALTEVKVTTPDGGVTNVPVLSSMSVNARGQRLNRVLGNGVIANWEYDSATYREVSQTATRGGQVLQQIRYTYDPSGNIVQMTDASQEGPNALISGVTVPARCDYVYDAHYRLRKATGRVHQALLQNDFVPSSPGTVKGTRHISFNNGAAVERFTRTYDFDASGNLRFIKHVGASHSWTTDMWISPMSNRSVPALDSNGIAISNPENSFDVSGNLIRMDHLRLVEWNWRNSLERAVVIVRQDGPDDSERYVYGADSMRVRKLTTRVVHEDLVETTEKVYFHDLERKRVILGGNIVLERWSVHVNDGSERIAIVHHWARDDTAREVDDIAVAHIHYQLTTHQASVALELDEHGSLISYEEYFPYGGTAFIAGNNLREIDRRDYRYSNEECDDATGLYAYNYRYYSPWIGRWLSPDPGGPADDLNLYQFALGDPIRNIDPDGLDTEPGKITYVQRADVARTDPSDDAKIAAKRASLGPKLQPLFDSLSRSDQLRFATSDMVLVKSDLDDPSAGGMLLTRDDFQRKYLPKAVEWAKKHHMELGFENIGPQEISEDPVESGAGTGPPGGPLADPSKPDGAAKTEGVTGAGEDDESTNTTAPGASGTGNATTGSGAGTGKTAGVGADKGSTPSAGAGAGDASGKVKVEGTGGGNAGRAGGNAGQKPRSGSPNGSGNGVEKLGSQVGGGPDGVLGGTPFSPGGSLDGLGNPLSNSSPSNGADQDGQINQTRRRLAGQHGVTLEGDPKARDLQAGAGHKTGRRSPTGNGTSPGANKAGTLRGTVAAQPNANANATGHGAGAGGGSRPTGDTGALAMALKIAGYTEFEFGQNDPKGQAGGIPGGSGWLKGKIWQFIYLTLSVANLILAVKAVISSVAKGVLGRLLAAVRSPRAILREFNIFLREGAQAWRKFWRPSGGVGPGRRTLTFFKALFWDRRNYESTIRRFRNGSFLFKPRWFGTLERVGQRSLYTWEHIIPQSVGKQFPRLRPFVNSYLNSFLRLPMEFNSALGNRWGPKLQFYVGAFEALRRSWKFGNWIGDKIVADSPREPSSLQPAN